MKKFWNIVASLVCGLFMLSGAVACGGNGDGGSGGETPQITNVPAGNTLLITNDVNTYQFTLANAEEDVTWTSTVKSVATVSEGGMLTMLEGGYTEIIVQDKQSLETDSVVLTIVDERASEYLTVSGVPEKFRVGDDSVTLTTTSSVGGAVSVTYVSSNPAVATVNAQGVLTPVGKGTTTVTVTKTDDSRVRKSVLVEVLGAPVEEISIGGDLQYGGLLVGDFCKLTTTAAEDCEDYEVEWSVDDTTVAVIDEKDNLIGLKQGTCVVTATVKGSSVSTSKTVDVCQLSADQENFRFAKAGTSTIQNVGPTITLDNVDADVVPYGEDQALKVYTRGNGAYNYFALDFGKRAAGFYKITLKFVLESGFHEGAIALPGEADNFTNVWLCDDLGDNTYSFKVHHQKSTLKVLFVSPTFNEEGVVLIDDVKVETCDESYAANVVSSTAVDFDDMDALVSNNHVGNGSGIYLNKQARKFAMSLVEDGNGGNALKIEKVANGYGAFRWVVGAVEKGQYKMTFSMKTNNYPCIFQYTTYTGANGYVQENTVKELNYSNENQWDRLANIARKVGEDKYEMIFNFNTAQENFAFSFASTQAEYGYVIIDDLKFEKVADHEVTENFEGGNALIKTTYWFDVNVLPLHMTSGKYAYEIAQSQDNRYLQLTHSKDTSGQEKHMSEWFMHVGYVEAGAYELRLDSKVLSGTAAPQFILRGNINTTTWQPEYYLKGAMFDACEKDGDTYIYRFVLDKAYARFEVGIRDESANDSVISVDNISLKKVNAQLNTFSTLNLGNVNTATDIQRQGIYSRGGVEASIVNDGVKGLKFTAAQYGFIVFNVGTLQPGNYKWTIKATMENGFPAVVSAVNVTMQDFVVTIPADKDIYFDYRGVNTLTEFAKANNDTYEIVFSVTKTVENIGLALASNIAETSSITIYQSSFEAIDYTNGYTLDFEAQMPYMYQNKDGTKAGINVVGFASTDFEDNAKGYKLETITHEVNGVADNKCMQAHLWGWDGNIELALGYLQAGTYTVSVYLEGDAWARGTFGYYTTAANNFATKYTAAGTYEFTFTLTEASRVMFTYKDGANGQTNAVVYMDALTITQTA